MGREGRAMRIGTRPIGPDEPAYVIAEAGVNHNGQRELALRLVEAAAAAGADAVKFQTFRPEQLVTAASPKAGYQLETTSAAESQLEMLAALQLSEDDHHALLAACVDRSIQFLSTPFDAASARFLHRLGVPAFKLGSGELTDHPLLDVINGFGKPVLLSTGMSWLAEVEAALEHLAGCEVALLHCVSNYPAEPGSANLRAMDTLAQAFGRPVGYSDHTEGADVALAAVARGACLIEKHLTLDRSLPGPDHQASLEPAELAQLIRSIRRVEAALGDGRKRPQPTELNTRKVARKSVVALRDLRPGETLDVHSVGVRRPGTGLAPGLFPTVLGSRARISIAAGTPLSWHMLDGIQHLPDGIDQ